MLGGEGFIRHHQILQRDRLQILTALCILEDLLYLHFAPSLHLFLSLEKQLSLLYCHYLLEPLLLLIQGVVLPLLDLIPSIHSPQTLL